jgi:hypothetical protein
MQSCPDEILDMIADLLYEPWDEVKKLTLSDLWSLALTCTTMARVTRRYRFRTVVLEKRVRNDQLASVVEPDQTPLAGTTQLVWTKHFEGLSQWMTSSTATVVMDHLDSVTCLVIRKVPVLPYEFIQWRGAPKMFASIRELRIVPYLLLYQSSDLFELLELLPLLEVLQIKLERVSLHRRPEHRRQQTSLTNPESLSAHPSTLQHLRTLDLQAQAHNRQSSMSLHEVTQMQAIVANLANLVRICPLKHLAISAKHQVHFVQLFNVSVDTLQELHIHLPWPRPPYRTWDDSPYLAWDDPPASWKLRRPPLLELIRFNDIASVPPGMAAELLQALLTTCTDVGGLSICLSGHDVPWHAYVASLSDTPCAEADPERWAQLDEVMASSGCGVVIVHLSVSLPGTHQGKPAPEIVQENFPRCHALGKLRLDLAFKRPRHAQAQVSAWLNSLSAVGK